MNHFKVHASQASKILGDIGLTDIQSATIEEYKVRTKPLTPTMVKELERLNEKLNNPELPQTAKTFLQEWYAGDNENIYSKEINKGLQMEAEAIDFMADVLNFGVAEKNLIKFEDEFMIGTPDALPLEFVIDVKCPWNIKTFQENALGINFIYEIQLQVYMHLTNRKEAILFYALMDTPEDANFGMEVSYAEMPANERWMAYKVFYNPITIKTIQERVLMCRDYLEKWDFKVKNKLGRIN